MESDRSGMKCDAGGSVLDLPEQLVQRVPRCLIVLAEKLKPQVTVTNLGIVIILSSFALPQAMTYMLFYPIFRLVFGTLYPAYASYKAVRTKNVKEYVKWMMYWIVFALFTCAETFTDVFLSFWFPFYYEIKIILVLWLLSPATKGSSILYRKFVHPMLSRREQEIDEYIAKAKEQGYHTVLHLGTKGVNYATTVLMQTAIKSSLLVYKGGGGLVNQLRRSYSLSDLSSDKESDMNRNNKALKNDTDEDEMEETDGLDPRMLRPRGYSPRRSASGSGRVEMYFPEVDVDVRQHGSSRQREPSIPLSAEPLYAGHHATKSEGLAASREPLVRTASVGSTRSMRTKSSRGGVVAKRGPAAEDNEFLDLQGDEADYRYQEEHFYDVSSSLSSQIPTSIPFPVNRPHTPLSTVSEIPFPVVQYQTPPQSNNSASDQEHFEDVSDVKPTPPDKNNLPLYDAETDHSNLLNRVSVQSETIDNSETISSIHTSLSKDISSSGTTENVTLPHTKNTLVGTVLSDSPLVFNNTDSNTADKESSKVETVEETKHELLVDHRSIDLKELSLEKPASQELEVKPSPVNENKVDIPSTPSANSVVDESTPIIDKKAEISSVPSETISAHSEDTVSDSQKDSSSHLAQPTHTTSEVKEEESVSQSALFTESKSELPAPQESSLKESSETGTLSQSQADETVSTQSQADETVSTQSQADENVSTQSQAGETVSTQPQADETVSTQSTADETEFTQSQADETVSETTQAAIATSPLTITSAESLSPDNTMDISSSESQDSKYDSGVEHSDESVLEVISAKLDLISKPTVNIPTTEASQNINIDQQVMRVNSSSFLSVEDNDAKHLKDDSGSAYASVESLSSPEVPSRSSSQCSLRKEGRGGRYHKRPAPTPPPRTSESEGDNWVDGQDQITPEPLPVSDGDNISSPSPKSDKEEISDDVSSPHVTESDDSDAAVTARLVLKPGVVKSVGPDPNTKTEVFISKTPQSKIKKSKSKSKQGESGFSRLLSLPKNLFPFWSGKHDNPTSSSGQDESSSTYSPSTSVGSSNSAFAQVRDSKKQSQPKAPLAGWE
ncbi:uncharacterized protein [Periplaneta americana]|uniref:uncharacterized protein isoform X3 n=1 Tax=Periplaneta americana TaxID=6978 RepID=UPI0037E754EE